MRALVLRAELVPAFAIARRVAGKRGRNVRILQLARVARDDAHPRPARPRMSPIPTQLFVGPYAPSGKKTTVATEREELEAAGPAIPAPLAIAQARTPLNCCATATSYRSTAAMRWPPLCAACSRSRSAC